MSTIGLIRFLLTFPPDFTIIDLGDCMKQSTKQQILETIQDFRFPQYHEIPDVGLYLEQVTKYICQILSPLQENAITSSMISNYVKKGLVSKPVRKQYDRDQIAHLLFIALAKSVLSLDNLFVFIRLQERTYSTETAYNYFCLECENMLQHVFGLKETPDIVGEDHTDEKFMLRGTIIAICQKILLEKCFQVMTAEETH